MTYNPAAATAPAVDGTASIGLSEAFARADHVHPTDTSRAGTVSPIFTGTITGASQTLSGTLGITGATTGSTLTLTGLFSGASQTLSSTLIVTGLASLNGGATVPTLAAGTNSTGVANAAFVTTAVASATSVPSVVTLTYGATISTNAASGLVFAATLTGSTAVLANPTGLVSGQSYAWQITQDSTGSRLLTYGTLFLWQQKTPPVLSTAAGAIDLITAIYNGTNLLATSAANFG